MSITSTVVHRAETRFIEAADGLRPYVGCFWVITAQRGAMIRVVPDGSTSISIQPQHNRSSAWFLRGPLVEPQVRRFAAPGALIGIRLRPGVAYLVSGVPADGMVGRRLRLSGHTYRALTCGPCPSAAPEHYVELLQQFLIDRLRNVKMHPVVATALREIACAHGSARVGDVAATCGVSERQLNRLMRTWVGYGPKRWARIVRFQTALEQMDQTRGRSGATLATENGYFDQAHLTLDMAQLADATPGHLASRSVADFYKTRCDETP
jgi:AraC-like DNA-binding protein